MSKFKIGDKVIFNENAFNKNFLSEKDRNKIFTIAENDKSIVVLDKRFSNYDFSSTHISHLKFANSHIIRKRLGVK